MNHTLYMRRALELAEWGRGYVSPNPMVGCVIAQGDLPPDDVADMLARFS